MKIELQIVETVHYGREFTIEDLNALCVKHGIAPHDPEGETGDFTAWLQDEAHEALRLAIEADLLEEIEEESGNVQGQEWSWVVTR